MSRRVLIAAALLAPGCKQDEDVWVQFNGDDDVVVVEVTAAGEPGDGVAVDLTSSTGTVFIGDVWVEPGSGPVGTPHALTLSLAEEFEERVQRAEIEVTSERGQHAYPMVQDSAEPWRWVQSLTSEGQPGEVRSDSLRFVLYELVPAEEAEGGGLLDAVF